MATVLVSAFALAACGGAKSGRAHATTAARPVQGGTASYAEAPGASPNYIFPLTPPADYSVQNLSDLQALLYRPLYWYGVGASPVLNTSRSLAAPPRYTDGGRTVIIRLKHEAWSNGTPVTSQDVVFWINLLKRERANWGAYVPGGFPDNVVSDRTDGPDTVILHLNASYSHHWFTYNELSQITPLPLTWDRTTHGPSDCARVIADCNSVYNYLNSQAKSLVTYATNPLWRIVDGPWRLVGFTTTGEATFVPNRRYTGPDKPHLAKFVELPFTTDSAELSVLRSPTGHLSVGYLPFPDLPQRAVLESHGYRFYPYNAYRFNYWVLNYRNPTAGAIFKQLYIRQALQHLVNQRGWIQAFYKGEAHPTYGVVPTRPSNPYVSSAERHDHYPYSVAAARHLLAQHGWRQQGAVAVCAHPGSGAADCGPGVAGGSRLIFTMLYASGNAPLQEAMQDYKSAAGKVGIDIVLKAAPLDQVLSVAGSCKPSAPASCSWQMANWGRGWDYAPDYYPTGGELFETGAGFNLSGLNDPAINRLIQATHTSNNPATFRRYEAYMAQNLPGIIYQPMPVETLVMYRSDLRGVAPLNPGGLTPEKWQYVQRP